MGVVVTLRRAFRKMDRPTKCRTFIFWTLNIVTSIAIILINKWIYQHIKFPNLTLSMLHFITTFVGLCICEEFNLFDVKSRHINQMLLLAATFCGFVVFTNLSLSSNSVGTFQVAKVLTTPGVTLIQMLYYKKHFSLSVKFTLVPIILGVIMNFYYDLHLNILGTVFALLGVIITSLYQVLVNAKQSELQMNSMQLLYYQAPLSALFLCFCIPIFESPVETLFFKWTLHDVMLICLSCFVAFFCNLSAYWIIGNTSPLTYNMIGHVKFVTITLGGWLLFKERMTTNQWFGITLTLSGIILYTHFKMQENQKEVLLRDLEASRLIEKD